MGFGIFLRQCPFFKYNLEKPVCAKIKFEWLLFINMARGLLRLEAYALQKGFGFH